MQREEAIAAVRGTRDLTDRTERRLRNFWPVAAVWGALAAGSLPIVIPMGPSVSITTWGRLNDVLRFYWMAAIVIGSIATVVLYRRRSLRTGVPHLSRTTILLVTIVCLATPIIAVLAFAISTSAAIGTGWYTVTAVVTLVVGLLTKNRPLAVVSALLFGLAGASLFYASHAPIVLSSAFAVGYIGSAVIQRRAA